MPLQRTKSKFFDSDNESSDLAALVNDLDEEFSVVVDSLVAKEEEEEEEDEFYDAEEGVYKYLLFGDDEEEEEVKEDDKEEEEEKEDAEEEDDKEEVWYDSEEGEEFGSSLLPDDVSACSEMSIDMEEYGGIDGSAVAGEVQVGGNSGCGWYPFVGEDIMMEDEAFVEEEDVEMEEVADWMDVDEEFWCFLCANCHIACSRVAGFSEWFPRADSRDASCPHLCWSILCLFPCAVSCAAGYTFASSVGVASLCSRYCLTGRHALGCRDAGFSEWGFALVVVLLAVLPLMAGLMLPWLCWASSSSAHLLAGYSRAGLVALARRVIFYWSVCAIAVMPQ
ncbi:hypothetical protein V8B55DRAFT_1571453 [Mucor lusitanicus]